VDLDLEELRIDRSGSEKTGGGGLGRVFRVLAVLMMLAAVVVVAWLVVLPRLSEPEQTEVRTALARLETPGEADPEAAFSAAGWVKLPRYHPVFVTPLIEGRIEALLVIEGDDVGEGQMIARLYDKDYRAAYGAAEAAVAAAQATYAKMKAGYRDQEVAEARAVIEGLEAELETAEEILAHSRELLPGGAISLEELQRDEARVKTLRANLDKARQRLALLEEGFRTEDIALAAADLERAKAERDLARQQLDYIEITSPMRGRVLERLASRGQWVVPKSGAIVSLYDPSDLEARVDIGQDDLGAVYLGQTVQIVTRAEPDRKYTGKVTLIEPKADLIKNTVPVRVKLDASEDSLLFPDMVVKARFLPRESETEPEVPPGTPPAKPILTVPLSAVVREAARSYVFVVVDGKARQRSVVVEDEPTARGRAVIVSGLRSGERVIVAPPATLDDGTAVRIEER
jgi:RND family efflux transporter MFP subunit